MFLFFLNKVTGATHINLKGPKANTVNKCTTTPYTLSQKIDLNAANKITNITGTDI